MASFTWNEKSGKKIEWRRGGRRDSWCIHSPKWCGLDRQRRRRWTAKKAVGNWRQSPDARKAEKSSDDASTDGEFAVSILRSNVAWTDNVEDDGQKKTAVGKWSQSPELRIPKKVEWRRGNKRGLWCVRSSKWCGLARPRRRRWTGENCCWLLASTPWEKKVKKIEWRRDNKQGPWCVRFSRWCGLDRPRGKRWIAENCCGQLASVTWREKSKKKSSDDAATDGDSGAAVIWSHVDWQD